MRVERRSSVARSSEKPPIAMSRSSAAGCFDNLVVDQIRPEGDRFEADDHASVWVAAARGADADHDTSLSWSRGSRPFERAVDLVELFIQAMDRTSASLSRARMLPL